jgi:hypothetical protein
MREKGVGEECKGYASKRLYIIRGGLDLDKGRKGDAARLATPAPIASRTRSRRPRAKLPLPPFTSAGGKGRAEKGTSYFNAH